MMPRNTSANPQGGGINYWPSLYKSITVQYNMTVYTNCTYLYNYADKLYAHMYIHESVIDDFPMMLSQYMQMPVF